VPVYQAGRHAIAEYKLQTLVIVAEQDSAARKSWCGFPIFVP
jgi:hypothetical protein